MDNQEQEQTSMLPEDRMLYKPSGVAVHNTIEYLSNDIGINKIGSAHLITTSYDVDEPRFWNSSEICVHFSRKVNNKYLPHSVDNLIFGIRVLELHSRTVETTF